jgi:hypothetical protein
VHRSQCGGHPPISALFSRLSPVFSRLFPSVRAFTSKRDPTSLVPSIGA